MWGNFKYKTIIEKCYGRLSRLTITFHECVGMLSYDHFKKIDLTENVLKDLKSTQRDLRNMKTSLQPLLSFLQSKGETEEFQNLQSSLQTLDKMVALNQHQLNRVEELSTLEIETSYYLWKVLHGQKHLLSEAVHLLGKPLKKVTSQQTQDQEERIQFLMNDISKLIEMREEEKKMVR